MEKDKVKFCNSMVFRILVLFGAGITMAVATLLTVALPNIQKSIKAVTQDYMLDEATAYGWIVETQMAASGESLLKNEKYLGLILNGVQIQDNKSSYAYMVDEDGIMLYHPTPEKIGQPVENSVVKGLVADLKAGKEIEEDCVEYLYNGVTKYASYHVGADKNFILIITVDEDEVFAPIDETTGFMAMAGGITLIVLLAIAIIVVSRMVKPLQKLTDVVNQVADLNFAYDTAEQNKLNRRKDEVGHISSAIANLHIKLSEIISVIAKQGEQLSESSQKFGKTFEEITENVENVDIAVEGIAEGSTTQAEETTAANEQMVGIGSAIEANVDSVNLLGNSVEKMTELSVKADKMLDELIEINEKTSENIVVVSEQTERTNESAEKIKEALALIQDIAEQTNLLSLNASIEAARAGEAGKGFAVVAEQIRKLSEDSSSSAGVIEEIVKELIENSKYSVEKMEQVNTDADTQKEKLGDTKASFDGLRKEVVSVSEASKDILSQTEKLDALKNQVSVAVEQLAAISEENAASTEETSASMQTLTEAIEECKGETQMLAELSVKLNEQTSRFKF